MGLEESIGCAENKLEAIYPEFAECINRKNPTPRGTSKAHPCSRRRSGV
jgi:hypothetical protein